MSFTNSEPCGFIANKLFKVSIITATFNSESYITKTYNSILKQTHTNWEWLITDDCSTDNTWSILTDLATKDKRIVLSKTKINSGAAVARNISLDIASGDYVAFIDSDDLWLPDKLSHQIYFMGDDKFFSFTSYSLINEDDVFLNKSVDVHAVCKIDYFDLLNKKVTLGCSTVMLKRELISGISMPLLRTGQDYAFWLKILKLGNYAYLYPNVMTLYRITPGSISRNKFKKAIRQWQIYTRIEKLPFFDSCFYFFNYALNAVFRK